MLDSKVVSHEEWLKARLELLGAEKEFTRHGHFGCSIARHRVFAPEPDILGKAAFAVRHPWPVAGLRNR
jgi:hypothetical protein